VGSTRSTCGCRSACRDRAWRSRHCCSWRAPCRFSMSLDRRPLPRVGPRSRAFVLLHLARASPSADLLAVSRATDTPVGPRPITTAHVVLDHEHRQAAIRRRARDRTKRRETSADSCGFIAGRSARRGAAAGGSVRKSARPQPRAGAGRRTASFLRGRLPPLRLQALRYLEQLARRRALTRPSFSLPSRFTPGSAD